MKITVSNLYTTTRKLDKFTQTGVDKYVKTANKLASDAAVRYLKRETPTRFTGSLKRAYSRSTSRNSSSVFIRGEKQVKKFNILDKGRKSVVPRNAKFLYIPLNKRGFSGYGKKLKSLKFGVDFVLTKFSNSVPPKGLRKGAINVAKARFNERMNLMKYK